MELGSAFRRERSSRQPGRPQRVLPERDVGLVARGWLTIAAGGEDTAQPCVQGQLLHLPVVPV